MGARFWIWLLFALVLTLSALTGVGLAVSRYAVEQPRERYLNSAFEFDLAPGWTCHDDGTETLCNQGKPPYVAIVVMAMKERNDQDNLDAYEKHLSSPKSNTTIDGAPFTSEVRLVRRRRIGEHIWVESLHFGSEIPEFDTYYLATNTAALGVLVTMSVRKDRVAEFSRSLNEMIASLTIHQRL